MNVSEWVNIILSWLCNGLLGFSMYKWTVCCEKYSMVHAGVLEKGLQLLGANGGWLEINQLLFADDMALLAD